MKKSVVSVLPTREQAIKVLKLTEERTDHFVGERRKATSHKAIAEAANEAADFSLITLEIGRALERCDQDR